MSSLMSVCNIYTVFQHGSGTYSSQVPSGPNNPHGQVKQTNMHKYIVLTSQCMNLVWVTVNEKLLV